MPKVTFVNEKRTVEVERGASLRGVEREPEERPLGVRDVTPERRAAARRVAAGRLDLHDVRTEVAEEFAGEEAGLVRQVEDADALEVATLGSHVRSRKLAAAAGVVKAKSVRRGVRRCDLADASCFGVGAPRETAGAPATPGGMDPACRTCANVPSVPVSSPPWRLP